MKTLISTLFLAGSLVLSGCGNNSKEENKKSELENYNQENQHVYRDFVEFFNKEPSLREGGRKDKETGIYYYKEFAVQIPNYGEFNFIYVFNEKTNERFKDSWANGMSESEPDYYADENENIEHIWDMSPEKQLEVAKEYKVLLTEIMHEAKYKNY